jgi:ABC-type antimicrobial peptide transport system permease subunit
MKTGGLILRGLWHYRRTHAGVLIGTAIAAAVLVGALAVGDSVDHTLRQIALNRLGKTYTAMALEGRFFRDELAGQLEEELSRPTSALLMLRGSALKNVSEPGGQRTLRANQVHVYGVADDFWQFSPAGRPPAGWSDGLVLNEALAGQLDAQVGDRVVLRVSKPSAVPRDAPLATGRSSEGIPLDVTAIVSAEEFGLFGLQANQSVPLNAFVPRQMLQDEVENGRRSNFLLVGGAFEDVAQADRLANEALAELWRLEDVGLKLRRLDDGRMELISSRVFMDDPLAEAAMEADPQAYAVLSYMVNRIEKGDKFRPYSFAAGIAPPPAGSSGRYPRQMLPPDLSDDQIVLNEWTASRIDAREGETITLKYWVLGKTRRLEEVSRSFRLVKILPMTPQALDPKLMPEFPGMVEAKTTEDWDTDLPIDRALLDEDTEAYWEKYTGAPKVFVTLQAGREMWANRYGQTTAIRFPAGMEIDALAGRIRDQITPSDVGLFFLPVRQTALNATSEALDFGTLFIGFSFFLIASAVLLAALLFVFGIQQRSGEVGTLLAMGYTRGQVRRLLVGEGLLLALAGALIGAPAGLGYTAAMLYGLSTAWTQAVSSVRIEFHATLQTVIVGALSAVGVSVLAMWLTLLRLSRHQPRELLSVSSGAREVGKSKPIRRAVPLVGAVLSLAAVAGVLAFGAGKDPNAVAIFFSLGSALLVGMLLLSYGVLGWFVGRGRRTVASVTSLGVRNAARRRGRSLATIALLASGSFLVITVAAFRQDPLADAWKRDSGAGGFAFYGELAVPVVYDLNTAEGKDEVQVDGPELAGLEYVQMRLRRGDDASCMNLNRAQNPRLLAVNPGALDRRGAFDFTRPYKKDSDTPWSDALHAETEEGAIPAVTDDPTLQWGLAKAVGDVVEYRDEYGRTVRVKIVATIASSLFQGSLIVSERDFLRRFPSQTGYEVLLIDGVSRREMDHVGNVLREKLSDYGLSLTPAPQRFASFVEVEQAYLSIFGVVGALGLLLGSCAMGVVVLRNVLERRGELGLLRAVGFSRSRLRWMIIAEHWGLLLLGLGCGVVAAVVGVLPALRAARVDVPWDTLVAAMIAVVLVGGAWIVAASWLSLRGELLEAIRSE